MGYDYTIFGGDMEVQILYVPPECLNCEKFWRKDKVPAAKATGTI